MRIVCLCPSVTELLCDLGVDSELVGITRYCSHPPEIVAGIEKVGGTKDPKVERIVELAPDVVFLNAEENRLEDAAALTAAGVNCHSDLPRTVEQTADMVRRVGDVVGRRRAAQQIAGEIERRAERVRRAARGCRPVSWAYLIWRKPWMAAGGDTFVDALLSLAGGRNVFGQGEPRYPAVTTEELVASAPDVVLLATEPFPFEGRHIEELGELTGWPADRFQIVDGQDLSWHGSRTPRGIDYAAQVIDSSRRHRNPG